MLLQEIERNNQKDLIIYIIKNNIESIIEFIKRLLSHDGKVNVKLLYKIMEKENNIYVDRILQSEKRSDFGILMGGEIPNSFCPIYEISYFFQAWFLSGIGTCFLNTYNSKNYRDITEPQLTIEIKNDILALSANGVWNGLSNPLINIICSLDTDIEPYRYIKHQLWRLKNESLKKRCSEISKGEFGISTLDLTLRGYYWIDEDEEIAEKAMRNSKTLPEAKAIQYYLTIKEFLNRLNIDIRNIPLYFNFVPKEEILALGQKNEILSVIIALHEKKALKVISKLTKKENPWIITFSCPKCGESSKRIISSHLKADCKTLRITCSPSLKEFRNECGMIMKRRGCGNSFEVKIPNNPEELYEVFKNTSFGINFAVRELLAILKTTADSPMCWPVTEIGVRKEGNRLIVLPDFPKGFGDHRELLTSMLAIQHLFVNGLIAQPIAKKLIEKGIVTKREIQLFAYTLDSKLHDTELFIINSKGKKIYATDTSALKALKNGIHIEEFFKYSVNLHCFSLEELLKLRNLPINELYSLTHRQRRIHDLPGNGVKDQHDDQ